MEGLQSPEPQNEQYGKHRENEGNDRRRERIDAGHVVLHVVAGGQEAAGEGNDRQVRAEDGGVRDAERRRGGHVIAETGLHDEAGDGETGAGNDGRKQPGDAGVLNDPDRGLAADAEQCPERIRQRKAGRAGEQRKDHSHRQKRCECDEQDQFSPGQFREHGRSVSVSLCRTVPPARNVRIVTDFHTECKPPGGMVFALFP